MKAFGQNAKLFDIQRGEVLHFWMENIFFVSNTPSALGRWIALLL